MRHVLIRVTRLGFFGPLAVLASGLVPADPVGGLAVLADPGPVHYPPTSSHLNNLIFALTGSGAYGIYTSSETPDSQYGTYNWCNMPHVRPREYKIPPENYTLQYVEVIQRHHKRTPYASNTFFKEDVQWTCVGSGPTFGATNSDNTSPVQWNAFTDSSNPWATTVGPGFVDSTCQFPQITDQGLEDSIVHGKDLRAVYAARLGLSPKYDPTLAKIRVTNNVITSQVASGLVAGLFPDSKTTSIQVLVQSANYDSLEPKYPCNKASSIRTDITTGSQGSQWKEHLSRASAIFDKLDKVSGFPKNDGAGWHNSFDHYYDNLSAKQCHGKALPHSLNDTSICVTQEDANTVYRLGNWEYSYLYRDAPASIIYSALKYGAWVLELKEHLLASVSRGSKVKYFHNVGHDGSISSLLGLLQIDQMVWPGMGSEVVFELYNAKSDYFVRALWGGQPMKTSTPLGVLDMIPLQDFFKYIDSTVGSNTELVKQCDSRTYSFTHAE